MRNYLENEVINNIYYIGRNYVEHVEELGNKIEDEPVVFLKPNHCINNGKFIELPAFSNDIHHEVELVLLVGEISSAAKEVDEKCISGYTVGIDLTARDVQKKLKENGLPWTLAKGFKGSAVVSNFIREPLPKVCSLELSVNGQVRQSDTTDKMIFDIPYLLKYLNDRFGLQRGDLIFTGTPSGVGRLFKGDQVIININNQVEKDFEVR